MRQYKFRAWDKKNKQMKIPTQLQMCYFKTLPHAPQGQIVDIFLNNDNESYFPNEVELMQYTGLKDKNGKEIYEGDIILVARIKSEIIFNKETASFAAKYDEEIISDHLFGAEFCEVIGNIYENKELMKLD